MKTKRGLGRGLGALIPTAPVPDPADPVAGNGDGDGDRAAAERGAPAPPGGAESPLGAYFAELASSAIRPNPRQPRQVFDSEELVELVASIRQVGLLQPVVVRPLREADGVTYELVMGERRWRAARDAGLATIPAIVRETGDDAMLRDALLENLHRSQLNPLEEAAAYQQLLDDFGCTHDELAARISRSRPQVTNTLRLLRLTAPVQRRVAAGVLSAGHARALVSVADPQTQERLARRTVAEGLSVRTLEELVAVGAADEPATGAPARSGRSSRAVAPRLHDVAARLSERYDTRVKVELGARKGRITVEFATLDDLERIVSLMDARS